MRSGVVTEPSTTCARGEHTFCASQRARCGCPCHGRNGQQSPARVRHQPKEAPVPETAMPATETAAPAPETCHDCGRELLIFIEGDDGRTRCGRCHRGAFDTEPF